jgi:hypothetical protein
MQALAAAGRPGGGVESRAVAYLRGNRNADGGFGSFEGRSSNAQSTAYAVQGLTAAGTAGNVVARALVYLRSLQRRDGSVNYSRASAQTPVWVTAQALLALRRKPFPLGRVPRKRGRGASTSPPARASGRNSGRRTREGRGRAAATRGERSGATGGGPSALASVAGLRRASAGSEYPGRRVALSTAADGPPAWLVAVVGAATLALLAWLRRRLRRGQAT